LERLRLRDQDANMILDMIQMITGRYILRPQNLPQVKITFDRASYDQVNRFASLIREESPFMFLSEVKIEPNYPPKSRPYDPTTFDASFEVSSVEFNDQ